MRQIIDLNTVAEGALLEKANQAMQQVVENISDPNTEATKIRKVTIVLTLKPNDERDLAPMQIDVKTQLAPAKGVNTKFLIGEDSAGFTAGEMKSGMPGQMFIDQEGDVADDKGVKVENIENQENVEKEKVVLFQ
ncbi:replication terminator protein [Viridibacillus sp. FSL R5-0468]|uniref:replication terminator protein n=1 Tax=Viridibacillus sp. FSL R5-0468 TaxID=2921640 RepID=UPI0030FC4FD7